MSELVDAALDYLTAGLRILALEGKRPNPRVHGEHWSWDDAFHGVPHISEEREQVEHLFSEQRGTTGIAILIPPGIHVADVDSDRAAALLKSYGWKVSGESVIAKTKNGLHIWFASPDADRNRWVGDGQMPDPGRTLLFKGFGGYVVAPPSLHFDSSGTVDGTYEWVFPLVSDGSLIMPDVIPAKAQEIFTLHDQWQATKPERGETTTFTMTPGEGPWWLWEKVWDFNTEGLERAIETAADGNQNNVIHWAAMTCRDEGVPLDVAMARLMAAAERGNHPRNRARDTIKGAYKRMPRD